MKRLINRIKLEFVEVRHAVFIIAVYSLVIFVLGYLLSLTYKFWVKIFDFLLAIAIK